MNLMIQISNAPMMTIRLQVRFNSIGFDVVDKLDVSGGIYISASRYFWFDG